MENISKFQIKKRINNRGYFAQIEIKIQELNCRDLIIEFECECEKFKESIIFGAHYFYEYYRREDNIKGFKITILSFNWMPVDTTVILASFVTIRALSDFLKINIQGLELSEISGDYNFPNP